MKEEIIRKLARSSQYQFLYSRSKEMGSIKLFKNEADYLPIQIIFLHWLETYNNLNMDIATGENFINKEIIEDDIRCDAYITFKKKKRKEEKNSKRTKIKNPARQTMRPLGIPSVIFKSKRGRK